MLSRRALDLSNFRLTDTIDKLHLSVRSVAVFHLPPAFDDKSDEECIQSMLQGKSYVTRGAHCRLVVIIYFEGKVIEEDHWQSLREVVEERLREAPFWKQIGLHVTLDREQPITTNSKKHIIRIQLSHSSQIPPDATAQHDPQQTPTCISPPDHIPRIYLEGLRLECNLMDLDWQHKKWTVSPTFRIRPSADSGSLLDSPSKLSLAPSTPSTREGRLAIQDEGVQPGLKRLRKSVVASATGHDTHNPTTPTPKRRRQTKSMNNEKTLAAMDKHTIVRKWVHANSHQPFPSASDKAQLLKQTGYSAAYLYTLLARFRTESQKPMAIPRIENEPHSDRKVRLTQHPPDPLVLCPSQEAVPADSTDAHWDIEDDVDEMLLSKHTDHSGDLTAHTPPLLDSFLYDTLDLRHRIDDNDLEVTTLKFIPSISIAGASALIETALRLSVGGKQRKLPEGLLIKSNALTSSLSAMCPPLFDPGFSELVTQNSIFASKIALDVARWANSAQSPGLRSKLEQLGILPHTIVDTAVNIDIEHCVQQRLWVMIHKFSYDTKLARNLKFSHRVARSSPFKDDSHVSQTLQTPASSQEAPRDFGDHVEATHWQQSNAYVLIEADDDHDVMLDPTTDVDDSFDANDESDFEDLLQLDFDFETSIELNGPVSLADQEKFFIEQETDEMLLSKEWDDDSGCDDAFTFAESSNLREHIGNFILKQTTKPKTYQNFDHSPVHGFVRGDSVSTSRLSQTNYTVAKEDLVDIKSEDSDEMLMDELLESRSSMGSESEEERLLANIPDDSPELIVEEGYERTSEQKLRTSSEMDGKTSQEEWKKRCTLM